MTVEIPAIAAPDQRAEALLDGRTYYVGRSWNETGQLWTLSLRDAEDQALIAGIAITPNFPLLAQFRRPGLPPGEFVAEYYGQGDTIGRDDFGSGVAVLTYVEQAEALPYGGARYNGSV